MNDLDILFIGAIMDYDGNNGSLSNYIQCNGKWVAPFQFIYSNRSHLFKSEAEASVYDIPNLSICKLVDYLKRRIDINFHIIWHFDYHKDEVLEILEKSPPKLVAISSTLAFFPEFLNKCISWINKHKSTETKILLGGKWLYSQYKQLGHSPRFEQILAEIDADYYIINLYGEETLYRLLLAERADDFSMVQDLPNIAYRRRSTVFNFKAATNLRVYNGKQYRINHILKEDQTHGSPMIDFANIGKRFLRDIVHVRTAYSCPFRCRFCTFPTLEGKHFLFDLDDVLAQLIQLKNMRIKYIFFIDDTFNVPLKRFENLLDRMIEEQLEMRWVSFFRPQFSNDKVVRKMFNAGCRMVFCGFESGNDGILKNMNKKVNVRQYKQGLEFLHHERIQVVASYIIGYPGETYETAMDTLRLINDPRIAFSRGSVFYYDPDAPVGRLAEEYGLTGYGAEWRHNTMNSKEAAKIHLEIIDKLKGINVPISDGGVWSLFNLYCRGVPIAELKALYFEFNKIQKKQIQEAGNDAFLQYRIFGRKPKV